MRHKEGIFAMQNAQHEAPPLRNAACNTLNVIHSTEFVTSSKTPGARKAHHEEHQSRLITRSTRWRNRTHNAQHVTHGT